MSQSVDLTELAKEGKLDPTIGRDEGMRLLIIRHSSLEIFTAEIRRTIQSRLVL